MGCEGPEKRKGPRKPGSQCVAWHMPKIERTIADVNVTAHTFHFITPAATDSLKIPTACNTCHRDKSTARAADALAHWNGRSPWRMGN